VLIVKFAPAGAALIEPPLNVTLPASLLSPVSVSIVMPPAVRIVLPAKLSVPPSVLTLPARLIVAAETSRSVSGALSPMAAANVAVPVPDVAERAFAPLIVPVKLTLLSEALA
jgi:hypothetical protein